MEVSQGTHSVTSASLRAGQSWEEVNLIDLEPMLSPPGLPA